MPLRLSGGWALDITGEFRIPAGIDEVWTALNDASILEQCIPGCKDLTYTSDTELTATMQSKIGPVKTTFATNLTLSEIDPPNGYVISGEGKGGAAGFARGAAKVNLRSDGGETLLGYEAEVKIGGKIAQIGSRLIDATARKLANDFFTKFVDVLTAEA